MASLSTMLHFKVNEKIDAVLKSESWMISRTKFKSLVSMESILEGNYDDEIVKKIMCSISIETIRVNIGHLYKHFQVHFDGHYSN